MSHIPLWTASLKALNEKIPTKPRTVLRTSSETARRSVASFLRKRKRRTLMSPEGTRSESRTGMKTQQTRQGIRKTESSDIQPLFLAVEPLEGPLAHESTTKSNSSIRTNHQVMRTYYDILCDLCASEVHGAKGMFSATLALQKKSANFVLTMAVRSVLSWSCSTMDEEYWHGRTSRSIQSYCRCYPFLAISRSKPGNFYFLNRVRDLGGPANIFKYTHIYIYTYIIYLISDTLCTCHAKTHEDGLRVRSCLQT